MNQELKYKLKGLAMWYKENHGKHVVLTVEQQMEFKKLMKQGLEFYLSEEIMFDKNNRDISSLTIFLKGTSVFISLSSGVCVTVRGENKEKILSIFSSVISRILDEKYDFKYDVYQEKKKELTYFSVAEWSVLPRERLEELLPHLDTNNPIFVTNFNDCYTSLQTDSTKETVLSFETYVTLFGTKKPSPMYEKYIVAQILKRKDISIDEIYAWLEESKFKILIKQ